MVSVPVPISVGILVAIAALALFGMWRGWVGRSKRSAELVPDLPARPSDAALGAPHGEPITVTYVSTTTAGDWLDRVATYDLGARSKATVQAYGPGLVIERHRAQSLFIPAAQVRGSSRTSGMAGKFVGREGIVVVTWALTGDGDAQLFDTGLFPAHKADLNILQTTIDALVPGPERPTPESKEHT